MFMTIGERRDIDRPVDSELRLAAQLVLMNDSSAQLVPDGPSRADSSVKLTVPLRITRELDPEVLEPLHLFQWDPTNMQGTLFRSTRDNECHCLRSIDTHRGRFTLCRKSAQCVLEVRFRGRKYREIIRKEQMTHVDVPYRDTLTTKAASRDPVHVNHEQERRQDALLAESRAHAEHP